MSVLLIFAGLDTQRSGLLSVTVQKHTLEFAATINTHTFRV